MRLRHAAAIGFALLLAVSSSFRAKPQAEAPHRLYTLATAYCQKGITKGGNPVHRGVIAADPAVLPLGSIVRIDIPATRVAGIYTVDDTGGLVRGHHIDIYMASCVRARHFGRKFATVDVLKLGDPPTVATD